MRGFLARLAVLFALLGGTSLQAQFTWIGGGPDTKWSTGANWHGGSPPTPGSSATFSRPRGPFAISVDTSLDLSEMLFLSPRYTSYSDYGFHFPTVPFSAPAPVTISLGLLGLATSEMNVTFGPNIAFNLTAPQTWYTSDSYYDPVQVDGVITNNGNTLTKDGDGDLVLNGANNLTGSVFLEAGALTLGNNGALGTATLVADDYGVLQGTPGTPLAISNPISIRSDLYLNAARGPVTLSGPIGIDSTGYAYLYAYGSNPVTVSGNITLSSEFDIETDYGTTITFTGGITASDPSEEIWIYGPGLVNINGTVDPAAVTRYVVEDGRVIFGSAASLPTGANTFSSGGYEGLGYVGLGASGVTAATFLGLFDKAQTPHTIGFDNGITISDPINLTGFDTAIRVGSATNATIASTATITPAGGSYNFGGSGGTLTVAADLTGTNSVLAASGYYGQPLTLILTGNNTYTGGTIVDNSVIRFDNSSAFPATGTFTFPGASYPDYAGKGYIGFGFAGVDVSTPTASASLGGRFSSLGGIIVVGFDSPGYSAISGTIDLSGFPTGTYLGTSTALTLNGPIVPAGSSQPYSFAAVKDGHLTVATALTGAAGMLINATADEYFPDPVYYGVESIENPDYHRGLDNGIVDFFDARSTVTLTGDNSGLSGTVYLNGGRLEVGHSNALGTGTLVVNNDAVLAASVDGIAIANTITPYGVLGLDSTHHNFTINGAIDAGSLVKLGPGNVALNGSLGLSNYTRVQEGSLDVSGPTASIGSIYINSAGTLNLHTGSVDVYDLNGDPGGVINLDPGTTLRTNGGGYFEGTIAGAGSLDIQYGDPVHLAAPNTFTGGTTVQDGAVYASATGAFGTGSVTVSGGSIFLDRGVTFINALSLTAGTIGGMGTFAPSNGPITVGANQFVAPLLPPAFNYYDQIDVGILSFSSSLTFASDGGYVWRVADAVNEGGWSLLDISGTLAATSTAGAPFTIYLNMGSYADYTYEYVENFDANLPYSWIIAHATGGITGVTSSNVVLDTSSLSALFNDHPYASFSLQVSGNDLILNFTPVPEPSTWALLVTGGAACLFLRRRRQSSPSK